MNFPIIFQDEYLVVINKPAGVVVNRAESVKGATVQDWMEANFSIFNFQFSNNEEKEFIMRSGVVHRLDKETSGVMILAKKPEAFQNLKNQFKNRKTQKQYLALVHGKVVPRKGSINLPLKRNILNRHRFTIAIDGKMANTEYDVQDYYLCSEAASTDRQVKPTSPALEYSLVKLYPKTGRTHQLRVHLSHLGYPIVADPVYLGKRLSGDLRWCPRLFLHAYSLAFNHPQTGERVECTADLPEDLEKALTIITNNQVTITNK